jgi:HEAT repeat protein
VLPVLRAALGDPEQKVRVAAALALWQVADSVEGVPVLVAVLHDNQGKIDWNLYEVLCEMGPAAKETLPPLLQVIQESDVESYRLAVDALKRIDPEAAAKAGVR